MFWVILIIYLYQFPLLFLMYRVLCAGIWISEISFIKTTILDITKDVNEIANVQIWNHWSI